MIKNFKEYLLIVESQSFFKPFKDINLSDLDQDQTKKIQSISSEEGFSIDQFLNNGAKLEISNSHGDTILHQAAERGHHLTIQNLIKHKIKLNRKDGSGKTALMRAMGNRQHRAVKLLLEQGAEEKA
jgi:ankyrin repeat protein